jgi:hypothetical protein
MVWTPPTSKLKQEVSLRREWTLRADSIKVPKVEGFNLLPGPAPGFDRIPGWRQARGAKICRQLTLLLSDLTNNQPVMAALVIKSHGFQAGLTNLLSKSDRIALLHGN